MVKPKSAESELISKIIFGIEDVKGADVNIMDLTNITNTVCGYFIVCTGTSNTHVAAIVSSIRKHVSKELKEKPFSVCLLYTSPSPRDKHRSRMPSSA